MNKFILASEARTAGTAYSDPFSVDGHPGGKFYIDVTALTGTLDVTIQGQAAGTKWVDIGSATQLTGTGTGVLTIYPGVTFATGTAISNVLSETCRAKYVIGTGPITFSVDVDLKR